MINGMTSFPVSATPQDAGIQRATTIELFFDLVLVFAATQLTSLIGHPHGPEDYLKAGLVFVSLLWIYDGFVWLTSNLEVQTRRERWLMFVAMAGFFLMALGIPTIFGAGGLPYALGLLLVTGIHTALFARATNSSAAAIWGVAPYNFGSALLILAAAFAPLPWRWALWGAAVLLLIMVSLLRRETQFSLSPRHFAERHGLLMIVALGESIVALGLGARELPLNAELLVYAALGLFVSVGLWWTYFDRDDQRAEYLLAAAPAEQRARMALQGFGFGHFAMIFGIILIAAGLEVGIQHPTEHAEAASAFNLAAGLSVYLLGDLYYRRVLDIGPGGVRLLAAGLALLTIPLGLFISALAQVVAVLVVLAALWFVEGRSASD